MQRLFICVLAMGCVGASAVLVQRDITMRQSQNVDAEFANDAAFRDGLYLGRLARAANRGANAPIGRWATAKDRISFAAGYRHGFNEQTTAQ